MFQALKDKYQAYRKGIKVDRISNSPIDRLDMMKAGYEKFGHQMTERERARMKKEIKILERRIKAALKSAVAEQRGAK